MSTDVSKTERRTELRPEDERQLRIAYAKLENPSFAARLTSVIGTPVERAIETLPDAVADGIQRAARLSIERVMKLALSSAPVGGRSVAGDGIHKAFAIGTGAVGGLFGLPGLMVELPVTTAVMMRSIADIAAEFGEDPGDEATRLACVEVFALGGRSREDDAAESGYYGLRVALAMEVSAVTRQSSSAVMGLVRAVASRFGVVVTDKVALQWVPVVGALGGAALNAVFIQHFQDMARGHFIMRRLEREYGREVVRAAYHGIASPVPDRNSAD